MQWVLTYAKNLWVKDGKLTVPGAECELRLGGAATIGEMVKIEEVIKSMGNTVLDQRFEKTK